VAQEYLNPPAAAVPLAGSHFRLPAQASEPQPTAQGRGGKELEGEGEGERGRSIEDWRVLPREGGAMGVGPGRKEMGRAPAPAAPTPR